MMSFSPNRAEGYERYRKLMQKRRAAWGLFNEYGG